MEATQGMTWDEPAQASSPRGWLHSGALVVGFYLDYGPDHYRSPHSSTERVMNQPRVVTWCKPDRLCPTCQPGNILAVRYPAGPRTEQRSRYVETVEQAREWVESGELAQAAAVR